MTKIEAQNFVKTVLVFLGLNVNKLNFLFRLLIHYGFLLNYIDKFRVINGYRFPIF